MYLYICQQRDDFDLFKGHGLVSTGWLMNWATATLAQVGDKMG